MAGNECLSTRHLNAIFASLTFLLPIRFLGGLYRWFFNSLKFDSFTLDIDSSVMTRYDDQQGSAKGYNKHKPGRKSHHPLMAFVSEIEMVANFWLRSGDSHTANNFKAFLEETLLFLGDKKIGLLRLDSGFCSKDIFESGGEGQKNRLYNSDSNVRYCSAQNSSAKDMALHRGGYRDWRVRISGT
ncbi:MAG: transposase [Tannerella sp.]|jgi:hypothetical protein|nr:transposase [Tannerella sp.]